MHPRPDEHGHRGARVAARRAAGLRRPRHDSLHQVRAGGGGVDGGPVRHLRGQRPRRELLPGPRRRVQAQRQGRRRAPVPPHLPAQGRGAAYRGGGLPAAGPWAIPRGPAQDQRGPLHPGPGGGDFVGRQRVPHPGGWAARYRQDGHGGADRVQHLPQFPRPAHPPRHPLQPGAERHIREDRRPRHPRAPPSAPWPRRGQAGDGGGLQQVGPRAVHVVQAAGAAAGGGAAGAQSGRGGRRGVLVRDGAALLPLQRAGAVGGVRAPAQARRPRGGGRRGRLAARDGVPLRRLLLQHARARLPRRCLARRAVARGRGLLPPPPARLHLPRRVPRL
mmetsp:Transcript_12911/g.35804  ORF Transcript_12911/g.35804 Transcript_12911/m.35804 type:complete len:333 (-) Transcript_12911:986-1984(-)